MSLKNTWWKILLVLATLTAIVILQLPKESKQASKPVINDTLALDSPVPESEKEPVAAPEVTESITKPVTESPTAKTSSAVEQKSPTKKSAVKPTPLPAPVTEPNISANAVPVEKLPRLVEIGTASCGPCKIMRPLLTAMSKDYAGRLKIEIIDAIEQPEKKDLYNVVSIPTIIFFDDNGKELYRHFGFIPKAKILEKFAEYGVTFPEN